MIEGWLAVSFNALTVISICAFLLVILSPIAARLPTKIIANHRAESRIFILWLLVLSPWLVGIAAAVIAIVPSLTGIHLPLVDQYVRWHHPASFYLSGWHGTFLLLSVIVFSLQACRLVMLMRKNRKQVKLLLGFSNLKIKGVQQLQTPVPTAFTVGCFKPATFITSALREGLTKNELRVVMLHEQAHISLNHIIKKFLFVSFTHIFPRSVSAWFRHNMDIALEQQADSVVNEKIEDGALIAETLLKVKRLIISSNKSVHVSSLEPLMSCRFGTDAVEQRIAYLLLPTPEHSTGIYLLLALVIPMALLGAFSADVSHHLIELFLPTD